ncbi:MAG TPA: hypothetical protein PK797_02600 [Burkholderiaceae bacterium]|jgi:hypothetical protein|nr:hypothetical protein [Burkholderiaceae bacterium]
MALLQGAGLTLAIAWAAWTADAQEHTPTASAAPGRRVRLIWLMAWSGTACLTRQPAVVIAGLSIQAVLLHATPWRRTSMAAVAAAGAAIAVSIVRASWRLSMHARIGGGLLRSDGFQALQAARLRETLAWVGPSTDTSLALPQAYGEYLPLKLAAQLGMLPAALTLAAVLLLGLLLSVRLARSLRHTATAGPASPWLARFAVAGLALLGVEAALSMAVTLGWSRAPIGVGFPLLSWHPMSCLPLAALAAACRQLHRERISPRSPATKGRT